jgi:hypothetical protein
MTTAYNGAHNDALNGARGPANCRQSDPPRKPTYSFSGNVPVALEPLRDKPQWVGWDYRLKQGNYTKPPIDARTGRMASVSDPATWATFDVVLAGVDRHGLAGIGLVLTGEDDIVGIDLDDCVTDSGHFSPLAAEIIGYGETYAEVSPSGEGIRFFARGKIDRALKDDALGIEVYGTGRYLTVTGQQIPDTPNRIADAPRTLARLVAVVESARDAKKRKSNGDTHPHASDFFERVNVVALTRLDEWVPRVLPKAVKQATGGWRVTSNDLGRNYEEDLSIHPTGIRDFGPGAGLTPIDVVLRYGTAADAAAAALWLCESIAIDPITRGWNGKSKQEQPQSGRQEDLAKGERRTQAQVLIETATGGGVELFHSPDGTTYADITINGHRETWSTKGIGFRRWLRHAYYEKTGGAPNSEAMSTALALIEARAQFDGQTRLVHLRVAPHAECIYIDLCDDAWRAIEVDADGWRIVNEPPVRFRRTPGMLALPTPRLGGKIDELKKHVNLRGDAFVLVIGWALSVLRGRGPYPIVGFNGEQGSGKTTTADRVRRLVDPHAAPLRSLPRDVRDLAIAANNSHVLAFDNLSGVSADVADALCRLSTGGGFATRALYSDDEERIFDGQRPVMMTSIVDVATRADLADRTLVALLDPITENERKTDREVRASFEAEAPHILGALLDAVAYGLKRERSVHLNRLPRMADHAVWVRACEPKLWEEGLHMEAYDRNRADAAEIVLESDQVAMTLRAHMDARSETTTTSTELLKTLGDLAPEHVRRSKEWPPNARALSGRLRRLAPALRGIGIVMAFGREGHDRRRLISIKKQEACNGPQA